jgi:mRNA interferase MazF
LKVLRGELWWASLDPIVGSEQGGHRPILVLQTDAISSFTTTVIAIPITTNLRRSQLPSAVFVSSVAAGLPSDSVVLCHQMRVLDKSRLHRRIGMLPADLLHQVEYALLFTLGISSNPE